jgi:hypothetical protein
MPSNTSKGRGRKGSKFWMQTLVNLDNGSALSKAKPRCQTLFTTAERITRYLSGF